MYFGPVVWVRDRIMTFKKAGAKVVVFLCTSMLTAVAGFPTFNLAHAFRVSCSCRRSGVSWSCLMGYVMLGMVGIGALGLFLCVRFVMNYRPFEKR